MRVFRSRRRVFRKPREGNQALPARPREAPCRITGTARAPRANRPCRTPPLPIDDPAQTASAGTGRAPSAQSWRVPAGPVPQRRGPAQTSAAHLPTNHPARPGTAMRFKSAGKPNRALNCLEVRLCGTQRAHSTAAAAAVRPQVDCTGPAAGFRGRRTPTPRTPRRASGHARRQVRVFGAWARSSLPKTLHPPRPSGPNASTRPARPASGSRAGAVHTKPAHRSTNSRKPSLPSHPAPCPRAFPESLRACPHSGPSRQT